MDTKNNVMQLVNSGQIDKARKVCLQACNASPSNAELWFILSAICGQMKDYSAAEKYCNKVIKLNPAVPAAHYNLAVALRGQGMHGKAMASLKKAIKLQPDLTAALFEAGNLFLEMADSQQAIHYYSRVLTHSPDLFQAHTGMAEAYVLVNDNNKAIESYLKSLEIKNDQGDICNSLAGIYDRSGMSDLAARNYERAVELGYRNSNIYTNLGRMYALLGFHDKASLQYNKALELDSNSVKAFTGLALLNEQLNRFDMALEFIDKALVLSPDDPYTLFNYGKILDSSGRYTEAAKYYKQALANKPDLIEAYINLGNIYLLSGNADVACEIYSSGHEINPQRNDLASNMLMSMNYSETRTCAQVYDNHTDWGRKITANVKKYDLTPSTKSIVKIGYVSPDFRQHSVAYFFEAILRCSAKERVINYCYSDVRNKDSVTTRLEEHADHWRDVSNLDDNALANLIIDDGIDILVDLCGHIAGNRLPLFSRKPAPVQVSYLGYPNTTGLESIDYRLVDKYTDPDRPELYMTESPLYLSPGFLCYTPPDDAPDVVPLPARKNGFITFGSFNNLAKITQDVVETWSAIVISTPGSKLCLKARQFYDEDIRKIYIEMFEAYGVQSDRLILLKYSDSTTEHLARYGEIDIALDTFPYNGTTTTCEALWMGVSVITYAGDRHASRVGRSILSNVELPELIAATKDEYITLACQIATDIDSLEHVRFNMRNKLIYSPLLNAEKFVTQLENTFVSIART